MEKLPLVLLLILGVSVLSQAHVIELDEKLKDEKLYKFGGSWIVMFYAPWCAYCQKMMPAWEEVAKNLKGSKVHVAKIDLTKHPEVGEHHGVEGMPTIKMFHDGEVYDYEGKREFTSIVDFIRRVTQPPVGSIPDLPSLKGVEKSHSVFFVLSYTVGRSSQLKTRYTKAASKLRLQSNFYEATSKDVHEKMGVTTVPSIAVYRDGQSTPYTSKNITEEAIEEWVASERFPLCPHLDDHGVYDYIDTKKPVVFGVIAKIRSTTEQKLADHVRFIAYDKSFHDDFYFATTDEVTLLRRMLLRRISMPTLAVWDFQNKTYWLFPENDFGIVTQKDVEYFLGGIRSGEIAPSGGDHFLRRFYRMFWLMGETVGDVYSTAPWVVIVSAIVLTLSLVFCVVVMFSSDPEKENTRLSARLERDQLRRETPGNFYNDEKVTGGDDQLDENDFEDDEAKEAREQHGKVKQS